MLPVQMASDDNDEETMDCEWINEQIFCFTDIHNRKKALLVIESHTFKHEKAFHLQK